MLTRLYADNFRCLVNFELLLDETNVLLGANGSGKTSVLDVLGRMQEFIVRGARVGKAFPARDLSLTQARDEQRFELARRPTVARPCSSTNRTTISPCGKCSPC